MKRLKRKMLQSHKSYLDSVKSEIKQTDDIDIGILGSVI